MSVHKAADSSVVIPSRSFESPRADYGFMVISTKSSSSESLEFLVMIQHVVLVLLFLLAVSSLSLSPVYH